MKYEDGCYFCYGQHIISKDGTSEYWIERGINREHYLITITRLDNVVATNKLTINNCPQCGRDLTRG